jgi:hypothetical protein
MPPLCFAVTVKEAGFAAVFGDTEAFCENTGTAVKFPL